MKNTLKPLDRRVCACLTFVSSQPLRRPWKRCFSHLKRELFLRGFTVRVTSLNLDIGECKRSTKAAEIELADFE